jgi:hypothetical protein
MLLDMGARVSTHEKIRGIVREIDQRGRASLTRLTVLKKWLEVPARLSALGLWIAHRAAFDSVGREPDEERLLAEARMQAFGANPAARLDRRAAEALQERVAQYKREFRNQQWGPVRVVHSWPLYLVEGGLALALGHHRSPTDGYKLAADWAQNFDARYGNGFNGPSRDKLVALAEWMEEQEKFEYV